MCPTMSLPSLTQAFKYSPVSLIYAVNSTGAKPACLTSYLLISSHTSVMDHLLTHFQLLENSIPFAWSTVLDSFSLHGYLHLILQRRLCAPRAHYLPILKLIIKLYIIHINYNYAAYSYILLYN